MYKSLLRTGESKVNKRLVTFLLIGVLLISSLVALADVAPRQDDRPDLGIEDFSTNVTRPQDGDVITLTITVRNYAVHTTSLSGNLWIFEDVIDQEHLVNPDDMPIGIIPLFPSDSTSYGIQYDTFGKRGTRTLYAMITDVDPIEYNSTYDNNNATLELIILNDNDGFDWIYDSGDVKNFNGERRYAGFIALYDNAKVTFSDCDVVIEQESEYQYGILVADTSKLDIKGCKIYSNYPFYITISDNAKLLIENSNLTNATIRSMNVNQSSDLIVDNSILTGGLQVGVPLMNIADTTVTGDFLFSGGTATISNTAFYLNPSSVTGIIDTNITADEISIFYEGQKSEILTIWASGGSNVVLKKLWDIGDETKNTIMFDALDTARIEIWRELEIHVADTTDLPIAEATVEVYSETAAEPGNQADSGITNADGNVTFVLLSDIIVQGNDGYKGNYEIAGKFTDDRGTEHTTMLTYRLAIHPSLSYNDSHDELDLIFNPVPPKAGENCYKPTGSLYNGASLGLTGCMQVTSPVTYVNSTITALQDKDFQAAIYIEGSGQLILENTSIISEKRMNIYIIGASAYLKSTNTPESNSMIKANAVVGVDGNVDMNSVDINANVRGKYKNFNVQSGSLIMGTWLSEAASMSVFDTDIYSPDMEGTSIVTGGSLSIGGGDFFVNHFELNSTSMSAIQGSDMWGNSMTMGEDPELKRWYNPGSSLVLSSSGICQVINSDVHYDIFELHCKGFNAEKSSFNRDIVYDADATSGTLTSIEAPAVTVLGDATVTVWFSVSINVTNSLGGPISEAPITITRMGGSKDHSPSPTSTGTDGIAEFKLVSEKITSGNVHEWMGNYRVTIEGCPEADPFIFAVGGGKGDQHYTLAFEDCVPAIEGIQYTIFMLNRTIIEPPNNSVKLWGQIMVIYEGGITLPPSDVVDVNVLLPGGDNIKTETLTGDFNVVFDLMNKGLMPEDQDIWVNATYKDPSNPSIVHPISARLNITVLPEKPKKLREPTPYPPTPGLVSLTNKDMYKAKEGIVISGQVVYDTGTAVPAGSSVQVQILGTMVSASGTTGQNGVFTIQLENTEKPKKDTAYIIQTKVTATHPYYTDLTQTTQKQDTIIIEGAVEEEGPPWFLFIMILIVIIVVVVVAVILVYTRMKTWGTLVECGECGEFISESAGKCPKCGTEFEREVVKCSECDAWIPALATECPKCGVKFKDTDEEEPGPDAVAQVPPPPQQPPAQPGAPQQPPPVVQKVKRH